MANELTQISGFRVKKFNLVEGKKEEDSGKITITLEGYRDDIKILGDAAFSANLGDIVAALNIYQVAKEPLLLQLRFEEEV